MSRGFAFAGAHLEPVVGNSRVKKSGKELLVPLRCSILKSNTERIACHLAKILFRCNILNVFFKNKFGRLAVYAKEEFFIQKIILEFGNTLDNGKYFFLICGI